MLVLSKIMLKYVRIFLKSRGAFFAVQFLRARMDDTSTPDGGRWTMEKVLKYLHQPLEAMPSVITVLKHALTFGASTALCENSFSTLKNVFSDHRQSMLHKRKANLMLDFIESNILKLYHII